MKTQHFCRPRHFVDDNGHNRVEHKELQYDRTVAVSSLEMARQKNLPIFEVIGKGMVTLDITTFLPEAEKLMRQSPGARIFQYGPGGVKHCISENGG